MGYLSRRAVLRLIGVSGIGISTGCLSSGFFGSDKYTPGTLVVKNKDSLPHIIEVSVVGLKSYRDEDDKKKPLIDRGRIEGQISIDAGKTKVYPDFLKGSTIYKVKMQMCCSEGEDTRNQNNSAKVIEFSPTAVATPKANGSFLTIRITENGKIKWNITYNY